MGRRPRYVLALDQGTTSSRALLFDRRARLVALAQREHPQSFPRPGWVEHDGEAIWRTQLATAREALRRAGAEAHEVAALGIANQRETALVWERASGRPIHPAIVWQCRRTSVECEVLRRDGHEPLLRRRTGLVADAYFAGTKLAWLLDHVRGARRRAERGELAGGTIDTWLLWRLTGGRVHATDASNASRTLLFDLRTRRFEDGLLRLLRVPRSILPEVVSSSGVVGETEPRLLGHAVPVAGVAGDQQAALFGQGCFEPGSLKCTLGTGAFLLMNVGSRPCRSRHGLLTTVAWQRDGAIEYALEGSIFVAGAAVQWLRDGLRVIERSADVESLAASVPDSGGVVFVPALVGLGAPWWEMDARGAIFGLTRGTTAAHLARATLEAIAFQVSDVVECMERDAGVRVRELRLDGGAARDGLLCQLVADLTGRTVVRPKQVETTALGAAFLAGLGVGFWKDQREVAALWRADRKFRPRIPPRERETLRERWHDAIDRVRPR